MINYVKLTKKFIEMNDEICLTVIILLLMLTITVAIVPLIVLFYDNYKLRLRIKTLEEELSLIRTYFSKIFKRLNKLEGLEIKESKEETRSAIQDSQVSYEEQEVILEEQREDLKETLPGLEDEKLVAASKIAEEKIELKSEDPLKCIVEDEKPVIEETKCPEIEEQPQKQDLKENFESYVGGKLLNRIGALALILGIGFFLKYAIDQNWINEVLRVFIGGTIGTGLLLTGRYFYNRDYKIFYQGLVGAGIGVLYLTAYATYNFYSLVPHLVAIFLMFLVTSIAFMQALKYDSPAISVLGVIGGFLTPVLLRSETPSDLGLFSYLIFLNVWIVLLLVKKKSWQILEFLSVISTCTIFFFWFLGYFVEKSPLLPAMFVTSIWFLYFGLDIYQVVKLKQDDSKLKSINRTMIGAFSYSAFYALVNPEYHHFMGLITVLVAGIYISVVMLLKTHSPDSKNTYRQYSMAAIILIFIAIEIQFTGYITIILWSLESVFLVWWSVRKNEDYLWKSSLFSYTIATFKLFIVKDTFAYSVASDFIPVANLRVLTFIVLSSTLLISSNLFYKIESGYKGIIQSIFRYGWIILTFILLGVETNDSFNRLIKWASGDMKELLKYCKPLTMSLIWALNSLPLIKQGIKDNITAFKVMGAFILIIALVLGSICSVSFEPISSFIPIFNFRFFTIIFIIGSLMLVSHWINTDKTGNTKNSDYKKLTINLIKYTWVILIFGLITFESIDYFDCVSIKSYEIGNSLLTYTKLLFISVIWALYSLVFIRMGLKKQVSVYLVSGFCALVLSIVVGFVVGFKFIPVESFYPVINIRFAGLVSIIMVIMIVIFWLNKMNMLQKWNYIMINILRVTASLLIFALVSYECTDIFRKEIHLVSEMLVNDSADRIDYFVKMKQVVLSVVWLFYSISLMAFGLFKRIKILRLTAIFLFALSIVKIFIFDLSFLDQVYRIVSFIVLGVILLLVSFLYQKYKDIILIEDENTEINKDNKESTQ